MSELAIQAGERLYTAEEVAQRLSVSPKTIQRWCRDRLIKHYRMGHKLLRFSDEHIEQFLKEQEKGGPQE